MDCQLFLYRPSCYDDVVTEQVDLQTRDVPDILPAMMKRSIYLLMRFGYLMYTYMSNISVNFLRSRLTLDLHWNN